MILYSRYTSDWCTTSRIHGICRHVTRETDVFHYPACRITQGIIKDKGNARKHGCIGISLFSTVLFLFATLIDSMKVLITSRIPFLLSVPTLTPLRSLFQSKNPRNMSSFFHSGSSLTHFFIFASQAHYLSRLSHFGKRLSSMRDFATTSTWMYCALATDSKVTTTLQYEPCG